MLKNMANRPTLYRTGVKAKQQSYAILPLFWSWIKIRGLILTTKGIEIKSFFLANETTIYIASTQEKYLLCKLMDRASKMQPHSNRHSNEKRSLVLEVVRCHITRWWLLKVNEILNSWIWCLKQFTGSMNELQFFLIKRWSEAESFLYL